MDLGSCLAVVFGAAAAGEGAAVDVVNGCLDVDCRYGLVGVLQEHGDGLHADAGFVADGERFAFEGDVPTGAVADYLVGWASDFGEA